MTDGVRCRHLLAACAIAALVLLCAYGLLGRREFSGGATTGGQPAVTEPTSLGAATGAQDEGPWGHPDESDGTTQGGSVIEDSSPHGQLGGPAPREQSETTAPTASESVLALLGEGVTQYDMALPLEEGAARVLEVYRGQGSCVLVQSGYLDLSGSTWACVVQGDGWVEVTVVQEKVGGTSEVSVVHMDVRAWERELERCVGDEQ